MSNGAVTRVETADVLAIDEAVSRSSGSAGFGLLPDGFIPKPFARLLAEKLALARALFGESLDLSSGSAIRKLLEISALEDARTWAALGTMYDNSFVSSATGEALSRLGAELGIPRPFLEATGRLRLSLTAALPDGVAQLAIPRGARLTTRGGHHVALDELVTLSATSPARTVSVTAFYPGASHNLNPSQSAPDGTFPQRIDGWNALSLEGKDLQPAEIDAIVSTTTIEHTETLTGGERQWPDSRYRELLLRAPRSLWTVDAIRLAVALVPGVRQVQVQDGLGGLDIHQSIFGNFNFIERVFSEERDLGSPYYFTILVAPTASAIWEGPDGLRASVESAIEDLRPIGIFPNIELAELVNVGVEGRLVVKGLPLPTGSRATVNQSQAATALKQRLVSRLRAYVEGLQFGDAVRASEITWSIMNEPGIADLLDLTLARFPPGFDAMDLAAGTNLAGVQRFENGDNIALQANQIAVFVDDAAGLEIV